METKKRTKSKNAKKYKIEQKVSKIMAEHQSNRKALLQEVYELLSDNECYRP